MVQQYSTGHAGKLTSVQAGLGSLLTAGSDGDIRVFQPDRSLQQIEVLKVGQTAGDTWHIDIVWK